MISPRQDMTRQLVEQLTKAARSRPARQSPPEAVDYPFDRPNRFTRGQLDRLDEFAGRMADCAGQKALQMLQMEVDFQSATWTQHYARSLAETSGGELRYVVPISVEGAGSPVGMIGLSAETATQWLARLLGGCGPVETDDEDQETRELSDLESDLLLDIAAGFVEALRTAADSFGGAAFQATRKVVACGDVLGDDQAEEYCMLTLATEQPAQGGLAIVLNGRTAALLAGEPAPRADGETGRAAMRAHVDEMSVEVSAMLSASLSLREAISLAPGDVVVLNQPIDSPVDVEAEGRSVFRGYPARQGDYLALQFAEFCPME